MSTTKDKSQGPYTVDSSGYWVMTSLGGYREVAHFDLQSQAKIVCDELNAAYSAGQADRDELVKALRHAAQRFKIESTAHFDRGDVTTADAYLADAKSFDAILSRYPNP